MTPADLEQQLDALELLDLRGLREAWRERYGVPPKLRSPELLGLMLAWRMQAEVYGGLPMDVRLSLRRPVRQTPRAVAASGTRLVREWGGVRHEVTALGPQGYQYQGVTYRSLSQIARQITGVRWNGPRFFGLRQDGQG